MKNKNVVYSGKVGANTKPKRRSMPRKSVIKSAFRCKDGPMASRSLWLSSENTLTFTLNGQTGRYVAGVWEVA